MAQGDLNDITQRIRANLPLTWFGHGLTPILNAIVAGLSTAWANFYTFYAYTALQARIRTASGGFLDIISVDFFGASLPRGNAESDTSFRARIISTLLQPKGTRWAINNALVTLTGRVPLIIEPMRPADTGGYRAGGVGYSAGGCYGSLLMPYKALVTAYRQATAGIPLVAGYGISLGAYSTPSRGEYANISNSQQRVADAAIYAAIDATKPAGALVWTRISN